MLHHLRRLKRSAATALVVALFSAAALILGGALTPSRGAAAASIAPMPNIRSWPTIHRACPSDPTCGDGQMLWLRSDGTWVTSDGQVVRFLRKPPSP